MAEQTLSGGMKLTLIQNEMKAPKIQYNSYGKFNYRTTDEIQYFLKPLCKKYHTTVIPTSECVWLGSDARGAFYQKASVSMLDDDTGELIAESTAMAREDDDRKSMSAPQLSASAAQFAVKRALEQLLMLDGSAPEVDSLPQQAASQPVPQPRQARPVQQPRQATPQQRQARPAQPVQAPRQTRPVQPVQAPQNVPQTAQKAQPVQVSQPATKASQKAVKQAPQAPAGPRAGWAQKLKEQKAADPDAQFITAPAKPTGGDPWAANMKDSK